MENKKVPSDGSSKGGWISTLVHVVLSYYSNLVTHPLRSGLVYFLAGLVPALLIGWVVFPMALYSKEFQPLRFSHAIHSMPDIGIEGETEIERCLYCHGFREDGTFEGIPKIGKCMECHDDPESPLGEDPEEARFLKEYVAEGKEVPWLSYYRQPDCVYFSHIAHVKMGKVECRECHGDHGKSDDLPPYRRNRLTGYSINIWGKNIAGYKSNPWDSMKMDDCAECHTRKGQEQNNACFVCHK
ncbi:MAG: cytochrome c3 family protein [Deltaproteobacteria bacterium]|nr:cytochrome c3 family protein [Deltaproteobacteria bacterium]MBW2017172.1 cytochrome c3 family protein [Deltaproteobacteria bacterium]MBW2129979.1 cytochrome c3 family protein [Deltaproteobacteria bacterium]MBW2302206.1 cytochrome c3 family protein [Deltaproteobacteria bacterium]